MSRYSLRVVAAAVVAALGVAFVVYRLATPHEVSNSGSSAIIKVLVAAKDIPAGMTLAEVRDGGYVVTQTTSAGTAPADALHSISTDNEQQVAVAPLSAGDQLAASNFSATLVNSGPLAVPSGMLAVSIDVPDPAHVGTFLRPSSEIAIFATASSASSKRADGKVTQVLFPRVKVLAVGTSTTKAEADSTTGSGGLLITVVVTPKQAQKLIHAVQTTTLYFGLLNGGTVVPPSSAITDENLFDEVS